jgi:hypothetical protein
MSHSDILRQKDYVVVTCISSHRMRYVMHKDDLQKMNPDEPCNPIEWANNTVNMEECDEFSQEWMGEYIVDNNLISEEEMLELFDKDNDYLKDWTKEYKIEWVRKNIDARKDL